jgi:hypothetical protein
MGSRQFTRVPIALGASLIGVAAALLLGGSADAQAGVLLASVGVSVPGVTLSTPSVTVSTPVVDASVPSVTVSTPAVTVSTPAVTVSTPELKVSTPPVTVSTPPVTVSTPSPPSGTPTEVPRTGTPTSPGGGGSGAPVGGASSSGDGHGTTATAAAVGSSAVSASASTPAGKATSQTAARSGARRVPSASHGARGPHGAGAPGGSTRGVTAPARRPPTAIANAAHRSSAGHRASDPLDAIGRHIPLPLPVPDWSKPIILVLLLLALWFGVRSRMAARRARRLEGQHATLLHDVDVMQAALVPEIPARIGGAAVSVAYRPAEGPAAGGDFYDVFVTEPGRIALIVGDVAGHGHEALTQAALMRYTLRAYLQAGLEPRAALALAGRVLAGRTLEHFATVVVGVYDTGEGRLTYASAGHPPPILLGLNTREPLSICASPPIGWTVPTGRRQTTVSLPLGAVACFFTDGLIEARCKDDLLGHERLEEIVAELGSRPDAPKLLARVRAAALATPDDMAACILAPQIAGIAPRTHVEELEADARTLDGGELRRFLETCLLPTSAVERAIDDAYGIAAVSGTALARVELEASTASVTVTAPLPSAEAEMPAGWPHPAGQPSGAG